MPVVRPLTINPIVYAEVSIGFYTIEALDAALHPILYEREALPWEAGFLAGKCYLSYRRRVASGPHRFRTFTLQRMRSWRGWRYSRATVRAIGPIS